MIVRVVPLHLADEVDAARVNDALVRVVVAVSTCPISSSNSVDVVSPGHRKPVKRAEMADTPINRSSFRVREIAPSRFHAPTRPTRAHVAPRLRLGGHGRS